MTLCCCCPVIPILFTIKYNSCRFKKKVHTCGLIALCLDTWMMCYLRKLINHRLIGLVSWYFFASVVALEDGKWKPLSFRTGSTLDTTRSHKTSTKQVIGHKYQSSNGESLHIKLQRARTIKSYSQPLDRIHYIKTINGVDTLIRKQNSATKQATAEIFTALLLTADKTSLVCLPLSAGWCSA